MSIVHERAVQIIAKQGGIPVKRSLLACALILVALTGCSYQKNIRLGDACAARGDYPAALAYYRTANNPFGSNEEAKLRIEEASARWASELDSRATELDRRGHTGAAWLLAAKANSLAPRQSPYSEHATALRARLRKTADYPVAMEAGDARARLAIVEIEKRLPPNTAPRRALKGERPKATLRLAISEPKMEIKATQLEKSAAYKVGVRPVQNPEFDRLRAAMNSLQVRLNHEAAREAELRRDFEHREAEHDHMLARLRRDRRRDPDRERDRLRDELRRLEKRRNEARREWEDAHRRREATEREIANTGRDLGNTPQFIEEDVMAEHHYPATLKSTTARARLVAVIDHTDGRPRIEAQDEIAAVDHAESHKAQPVAGISEQYNQTPSANRIASAITARAIDPVMKIVEQSFNGYRAMLLKQADEAATDAERLDKWALYMLSSPKRGVSDEIRARIDQTAMAFAQIESAAMLMSNAR